MVACYFGEEKIGEVVANHPIYAEYTGKYIGNIEGPAASGRRTWRAILNGRRIGDFATAEQAMEAVENA